MLKNIIKDNILFILIILLLGYVIFTTNNIKTDVGLYNQKIDSIQHTVDSATEVNKKAGEDFLNANKSKPGIQTTASGLQYKITQEGTGAKPDANDKVTVHYHGTTIDGKVFDSSVERGQPATFGLNQVIPGWTEGLQLLKPGGKAKLIIPANLGYGANGYPPVIPPNSWLVFDVELIKVN